MALVLLAAADGAVTGAFAQRSDSWFGRLSPRPSPQIEASADDMREAREQAEAARLYGDAQKSIERGLLQDARNRLELLLARFPTSHLIDVARRDLKTVYERLASQLDAVATSRTVVITTPSPSPSVTLPEPVRPAGEGFRPAARQGDADPVTIGRPVVSTSPTRSPSMGDATSPSPTAKAIDFLKDEFRNSAGDRIFFTEGSAEFGTRARVALEAQASWLRRNQGVNVIVEGHADDSGSREFNRDLSRRRAEAVRDKLVEFGVDAARIETVALGRDRPVSDCNAPGCANQNRLVLTAISRVTLATAP